ncbi:MAG TPA: methyltransferase domain-containing protein [Hyphomicrobiaceae bacterium]|nr:methyltransferase domain-containing protein [Hyphomicrobiaceae bacterium]
MTAGVGGLRRGGRTRRDWAALGLQAARRGDHVAARAAFLEALKRDPRNAMLRCNLALAEQRLGAIDEAAVQLTAALRADSQRTDAAHRLGRLLMRYVISAPERLDGFGLKAALASEGVARQAIAEVALRHVLATRSSLSAALSAPEAAAGHLLLARTNEALREDLLLAALKGGVVREEAQERLFTRLRRLILLELEPARFGDRALTAFVLALIVQGSNNDYAWAESSEESEALANVDLDPNALVAGDLEAARKLMLLALYRPLDAILGPQASALDLSRLRPRPLRELVEERLAADAERRRIAAGLRRLSEPVDAVSQRVGAQYERSPYPQWQTIHLPARGSLRPALVRYFGEQKLAFMDRPFSVLIAGAGTGQHALQSAAGYGDKADVVAIDLSAPSLAYAEQRRRALGIGNVTFMVADILDLGGLERRFDVIECVGVLHHMADPWAGWRALLERLEPHGLMYVGLYSACSRRGLALLRGEAGYPGPGCSDEAARAYRAVLLERPASVPGGELKSSKNFWNLSEFRDLVLHPCEHQVTLEEIGQFLSDNGLAFRGFTLGRDIEEDFARRFPEAPWPGRLADWQRYEADHPSTFDGMYRFWCERTKME